VTGVNHQHLWPTHAQDGLPHRQTRRRRGSTCCRTEPCLPRTEETEIGGGTSGEEARPSECAGRPRRKDRQADETGRSAH
jgi:hypothetical protein